MPMGFSHKDDVTDPGESSFNEVCTKVNEHTKVCSFRSE